METVKLHRLIRRICRILLVCTGCLGGLYGCLKESVIYLPGELTPVSFSFEVPGMVQPRAVTYTQECRVDNVWILLFDNTWNYVGKYKGSTPVDDGDTSRKKFDIELPSGTFHLFAVINCETQLNALNLTGLTRSEVEEALLFKMEQAWGYTSGTFTPFPMWGELQNVQITAGTPLNQVIPVLRSVVRIDIKLHASVVSAWGGITSVYLYNRYTQGQVIPNAGSVSMSDSDFSVIAPSLSSGATKVREPLIYRFDPALDEVTYTIYTFETGAGNEYDLLNNTCLVLGIGEKDEGNGGIFRAAEGYPDRPVWFYRADFINDMGDYLPLLRNNQYVIKVDNITNRGFPEPGQAFRSEPYGLEYSVVPWEEEEEDVDVGGDIYRLDISETLLDIPYNQYETYIQVSTTHPDGWSAYVSAYPDRIDPTNLYWLFLQAAELDYPNYYPSINLPAERTLNLIIGTDNPGQQGVHTGYVHIVSGNLTNVVTIKKVGAGLG